MHGEKYKVKKRESIIFSILFRLEEYQGLKKGRGRKFRGRQSRSKKLEWGGISCRELYTPLQIFQFLNFNYRAIKRNMSYYI